MAKVMLICGKICAGKTTYAKKLVQEQHAVWLSCDDLMLSLFGDEINEAYYKYHDKVENFLLEQAAPIVHSGINVILDFGFWEKSERIRVSEYFKNRSVAVEWYYIDVSDETLLKHIEKRNAAISEENCREYFTDEGLLNKCLNLFEIPDKNEIDVWIDNP